EIMIVRSWQRQVYVAGQVEQEGDEVRITSIHGTFSGEENEDPEFTLRIMDYLIRSHALGRIFPVPLPEGIEADPRKAAVWCFGLFGNMAHVATPHTFDAGLAEVP